MNSEYSNKIDELKDAEKDSGENKSVGGIILVIIGMVALLGQLLPDERSGLLVVPVLAIVFLTWGALARNIGLLIPGGILSGVGLGIFANEWVYGGMETAGDANGALFLVAFAAGWGLITLMSAFFTDRVHYWPLIPGGILAAIGLSIWIGGPVLQALEVVGKLWPVVLIGLGGWLIWKQRR